ncbi:MAG: fibronectin type III domain-containing protein, partial [Desulfosarcinaceae bacterium]
MHFCSSKLVHRFTVCFLFIALVLVFQATAQATDVTLAWDANVPAPDGYKVFRRKTNENYNYQSPVWSGTQTTCSQTGLMPDTTYYFVVRAFQGTEDSGDSNEVEFRSATPEPAAHTITATAQSGGSISPSGAVTIEEGQSQTFIIIPDAPQVISNVLVDGQSAGAVAS